ncbi:hypothetical protein FB567DRAFT_612921 [Paraphoma chrysanthemicola]|uniref:Uncharacterized protein n=1 Tax=Paraphoma chrysanthemicola TaxID=798071 RepID=A0A8K0QVX3_9PLEO|nr:hypothetical protein FB567DRAFT_612921 [Paraphoma chrysanthemicola]
MSFHSNSGQSEIYKVDNSSPHSGEYVGYQPGSLDDANFTWPVAAESSSYWTTDTRDDSSIPALNSPKYSPPTPQPLSSPDFRNVDYTPYSPASPQYYTGELPIPHRLPGDSPSYVLTSPRVDTADSPSASPLSYYPPSPSHHTTESPTPDRPFVLTTPSYSPTTPSYAPTGPRFGTADPPSANRSIYDPTSPDHRTRGQSGSLPTYAPSSSSNYTGYSPIQNDSSGSTSSYVPNGPGSHGRELSSFPATPALDDAATSVALNCQNIGQSSRLTSLNAKLPRLRVADTHSRPSDVVGPSFHLNGPGIAGSSALDPNNPNIVEGSTSFSVPSPPPKRRKTSPPIREDRVADTHARPSDVVGPSFHLNAPEAAGGAALSLNHPNIVERSTPSPLLSPPSKRRKTSPPSQEDIRWMIETEHCKISFTRDLSGDVLITIRARDGVNVLVQPM